MKPQHPYAVICRLVVAPALALIASLGAQIASAQHQSVPEWQIWMKVSPCSGHPTEWLTVSNRNPNIGGQGKYVLYPSKSMQFRTFDEAMAARNASLGDAAFARYACGGAGQWYIWMKMSPCSGHPTEWLTVSTRNPSVGGQSQYGPYPSKSTPFPTFEEALVARNASLADPAFARYACGGARGGEWYIWMKTSPCSGHPTEWLTVSNRNPSVGGQSQYGPYPSKSTPFLTFDEAMAARNAALADPAFAKYACGGVTGGQWKVWMKVAPCSPDRIQWVTVSNQNPSVGGGSQYQEFPNSGSYLTYEAAQAAATGFRASSLFSNYCCRDKTLYRNTRTGEYQLRPFASPGGGLDYFEVVKSGLCCGEEAAWVPSGAPFSSYCGVAPASHCSACFAPDPAAGSTNWNDHFTWAQQRDGAQLERNLRYKLGLLFNCRSATDDQVLSVYSAYSVVIGQHVPRPACFDNDSGAVSTNRQGHEQWALGNDRADVLENAEWKTTSAFRCLNASNHARLFADLSVALAQCPGPGGGVVGPVTTGGIHRPPPVGAEVTPPVKPVDPPKPPVAGAKRWILQSATVSPQENRGWTYNAQSTSVTYVGAGRAVYQWTSPPQQIDSNGFTFAMSCQAAPSPGQDMAVAISTSGRYLSADVPPSEQQLFCTGRNGSSATGQKSLTYKPQLNSPELELIVTLGWGSVSFRYKYRLAE